MDNIAIDDCCCNCTSCNNVATGDDFSVVADIDPFGGIITPTVVDGLWELVGHNEVKLICVPPTGTGVRLAVSADFSEGDTWIFYIKADDTFTLGYSVYVQFLSTTDCVTANIEFFADGISIFSWRYLFYTALEPDLPYEIEVCYDANTSQLTFGCRTPLIPAFFGVATSVVPPVSNDNKRGGFYNAQDNTITAWSYSNLINQGECRRCGNTPGQCDPDSPCGNNAFDGTSLVDDSLCFYPAFSIPLPSICADWIYVADHTWSATGFTATRKTGAIILDSGTWPENPTCSFGSYSVVSSFCSTYPSGLDDIGDGSIAKIFRVVDCDVGVELSIDGNASYGVSSTIEIHRLCAASSAVPNSSVGFSIAPGVLVALLTVSTPSAAHSDGACNVWCRTSVSDDNLYCYPCGIVEDSDNCPDGSLCALQPVSAYTSVTLQPGVYYVRFIQGICDPSQMCACVTSTQIVINPDTGIPFTAAATVNIGPCDVNVTFSISGDILELGSCDIGCDPAEQFFMPGSLLNPPPLNCNFLTFSAESQFLLPGEIFTLPHY
jgi:hypothetical protein